VQLDELPAVILVIAISLIWFASRRYFEANRQLRLRRAAEAQLAEALAENKRLAQQYLDVQEYERKALARDLHDELGQYLNAIKLDAVSIREAQAADPRWRRGAMIAYRPCLGCRPGLIRRCARGFDVGRDAAPNTVSMSGAPDFPSRRSKRD
jgi:hypothetical protein